MYALSADPQLPALLTAAQKETIDAGLRALPECYVDWLHGCLNPDYYEPGKEFDPPTPAGACDKILAAYAVSEPASGDYMQAHVLELADEVYGCPQTAKAGFGLLALVAAAGVAVGALVTSYMRR